MHRAEKRRDGGGIGGVLQSVSGLGTIVCVRVAQPLHQGGYGRGAADDSQGRGCGVSNSLAWVAHGLDQRRNGCRSDFREHPWLDRFVAATNPLEQDRYRPRVAMRRQVNGCAETDLLHRVTHRFG